MKKIVISSLFDALSRISMSKLSPAETMSVLDIIRELRKAADELSADRKTLNDSIFTADVTAAQERLRNAAAAGQGEGTMPAETVMVMNAKVAFEQALENLLMQDQKVKIVKIPRDVFSKIIESNQSMTAGQLSVIYDNIVA